MSTDQKHTLLFVPNYDDSNPSGGTAAAPVSYLRLGSTASESEVLTTDALRGDDLLTLAGLPVGETDFFEDDHRASQDGSGTLPADADAIDGGTTVENAGTLYYRYDGRSATGTAATRSGLTEQLRGNGSTVLARGGWRDHTDGNRIVTVRGDRVDVVMGNYKRVILGRVAESPIYGDGVDDPLKESSWEVSGGHIFERTSTGVAAMQSIEWVKESSDVDGDEQARWKAVEKTAKGDTVTRYSGRIVEYFNGPWQQSIIGKDEENDTANPEIIDECYVKKHDSRVEADEVVEETRVGTQIEIDDSPNATLSTKVISPIYDITQGEVTEYIDTFNEELWTVDQDNLELYGFALNFEAAGFKQAGAGNAIAMTFGTSWSFSFGADASLYIGEKFGLRFGSSSSISFALSAEVNCGLTFKFAAVSSEFDVTKEEHKLIVLGSEASKTKLSGVECRACGFKNKS